jgi:hypothetical protein
MQSGTGGYTSTTPPSTSGYVRTPPSPPNSARPSLENDNLLPALDRNGLLDEQVEVDDRVLGDNDLSVPLLSRPQMPCTYSTDKSTSCKYL